jgi:hypothetical protein
MVRSLSSGKAFEFLTGEWLNRLSFLFLWIFASLYAFFIVQLLVSNIFNQPPQNIPYINNVTKADPLADTAIPGKAATCLAEGMGPGPSENVPAGTHGGLQDHYTGYSYVYELSKRIQDTTGYKLLSLSTNFHGFFLFRLFSHFDCSPLNLKCVKCLLLFRSISLWLAFTGLSPIRHSLSHRWYGSSQEDALQFQGRLLL